MRSVLAGPPGVRIAASGLVLTAVVFGAPRRSLAQEGSYSKPAAAESEGGDLLDELARRFHFDGELRFRYELKDPVTYTPNTPGLGDGGNGRSDDFVLQRTRLGFSFDLHPQLFTYIQIQDSRIWGEEQNPVFKSEDSLDLHQGYVDIRNLFSDALNENNLTFRLGRQELSYGDQRLVSPLDWSNVGRAWDAARLIFKGADVLEGLRIDTFTSIITETASNKAGLPASNPGADDKQEFHGLYVTKEFDNKEVPFIPQVFDAYTFYRTNGNRVAVGENAVVGDIEEVTFGSRIKGGFYGFDYGGEIVGQLGKFSDDDIKAWAWVAGAGYTIPPELLAETKVRLGVEYAYASGDSNPNDGDRGTFNPLFAFVHFFHGINDQFRWSNIQDLNFSITNVIPASESWGLNKIWLQLKYHIFWLADRKDGWFNAVGGQMRRDPTGSSGQLVGTEFDVQLKYNLIEFGEGGPGSRLWLWMGYGRFMPEEYVRRTGSSPAQDFFFASTELEF